MTRDPAHSIRLAVALAKISRSKPLDYPWFVCPDCCTFTRHPDDVASCYCPHCHEFKFEHVGQLKCFEPTCPNFGDKDFGEATCPESHAVPPARRER